MPVVEICVEGVESAQAAERGGADRVELCEHLDVGGVTPSAGAIAMACRRLSIPVHVLIRPRAGDFQYSEVEFDVMEHDVDTARSLGAAGVVLGVLRPDRTIDLDRLTALAERARPLSVTFHKAFDEVPNPDEALEALVGLKIDRILTSGQAATAREGLDRLAGLVRKAAGRIVVMAGGRLRLVDLPRLLDAGVEELHLGSAVSQGGVTDASKVRQVVESARSGRPGCRRPS